jgi:hypothetical protein
MTGCIGKGAAKRTEPVAESQSTSSDLLVESEDSSANSSFEETIRVLKLHGQDDLEGRANKQVEKKTSGMADPGQETVKCDLL